MVPVVVAPHLLPELTVSAQHWTTLVPRRRGAAARLGAVARKVPARMGLVAAAMCLVAQPIGPQDVVSLLAAADGTPRWAQRLVAVDGGSEHAPTFAFAAAATAPASIAIAGAGVPVNLAGFKPALPDGPMAEPRVDRDAKGARRITVAARTAPGALAAGSLVQAANFVADTPGDALPRVAFVKLPPVSDARARTLASLGAPRGDENDPAEIRARVLIAQAAAATSASLASAYAREGEFDVEAPFRALFADPTLDSGEDQIVTPEELAVDPHAWVNTPLPASVVTNSEQRCLAEAIYFEAQGEPFNGQVAVAQVVLNRVRNPAYPNTICNVVYQNKQWRNRCQFSFACDLVPDRVVNNGAWRQAQKIARETVAGKLKIEGIEASTHYHATYVRPRWAKTMQKQKQIGLHVFYKTYGGGWS